MSNKKTKYAPNAHWYLRLACIFLGHDRETGDEGRSWIQCQRCGANWTNISSWPGRSRFAIARGFLWLANATEELGASGVGQKPYFRAVDTKLIKNLGTKHSCDAYSYENLQSLMKQEGENYTLGQLFDESGWIEITDDNAEEMVTLINESFEAELNKQEREKTMRIMRGEDGETNNG